MQFINNEWIKDVKFEENHPFPIEDVGNIPTPAFYPKNKKLIVGRIDNYFIQFGEGVKVACLLEDKPK